MSSNWYGAQAGELADAASYAVGTSEDAWELAMHLIGRHADPMAVCRSFADNALQHHHEHRGPGTIRDHSPASRVFDPEQVERVLEECEANP